jgi:hypothetical protein
VVRTRSARYPDTLSFLALFRDGFQGWAKLVINAETNTLLGATFVGPEFSELVQAATLAIVAKVPVSLLRHAVAPHPTVNQVWDLLLAQESELAPLLINGGRKYRRALKRIALVVKPVRPRSLRGTTMTYFAPVEHDAASGRAADLVVSL